MEGLSSGTTYEHDSSGGSGSVAFADTGMSLSGTTLSNVDSKYVFQVAQYSNYPYYSIKNTKTSIGTYLADYYSYSNSGTLYASSSLSTSTSSGSYNGLWTLTFSSDYGTVDALNYNSNATYRHLSLNDYNSFIVQNENKYNINFWKETTVPATSDTTISYTVRYVDYDGTVLNSQIVENVSEATAPTDPSREGYTFTGWSTPAQNSSTGLYTITAQYQALPVVTFYGYDRTTIIKQEPTTVGGSVTPPTEAELAVADTSVPAGFEFMRWDGNYENVTQDENVYAVYQQVNENQRKVSFQDWDGTVYGPYLVDLHDNAMEVFLDLVKEHPDYFTRTGYELTGFDEDLTDITHDVVAIAQYKTLASKVYTLRLEAVYGPRIPAKVTHVTWYADICDRR